MSDFEVAIPQIFCKAHNFRIYSMYVDGSSRNLRSQQCCLQRFYDSEKTFLLHIIPTFCTAE